MLQVWFKNKKTRAYFFCNKTGLFFIITWFQNGTDDLERIEWEEQVWWILRC